MATEITWLDDVMERSTRIVTVDLVDEDGNAVTPKSANFTLTDGNGALVNSRDAVPITPLASTLNVVLEGDDLVAGATLEERTRCVVIEGTYDSSHGSDLPINSACKFLVIDLPQT